MGMQVGGKGGPMADINITPMIDIVLVLLIIFMVMTPLTPRGYDIQIPKEATIAVPPADDVKQVIMAIAEGDCPITAPLGVAGLPPDCTVRLNKEPCRVSALAARIEEIFKNRRKDERIVFVAAQEKLNYEGIMQILDVARSKVEGLKLAVVTDEKLAIEGGLE